MYLSSDYYHTVVHLASHWATLYKFLILPIHLISVIIIVKHLHGSIHVL